MNIQDNGQRNRILVPAETPGNLTIVVNGNDNLIRIGEGCRFPNARLDIRGDHCEFEIGDRCVLIGEFIGRDHRCRLLIGAETTTMGAKITMHESGLIGIGRDCMFSGEVRMDTSDMHSILDLATGERLNPPSNIEIGDHVWLGFGVYLTKGVRIGKGCIVGAQSLVTRDLPDHSLAAGVPARVLREGVTWDRRRLPFKANIAR